VRVLYFYYIMVHAQVGVSVNIGEPEFFGQIEIGNTAPPPVVYANPVVIQAPVGVVVGEPLYLRVPEEHHRNWGRSVMNITFAVVRYIL